MPSAPSEKHSNSLLARFDTQLQIIADRYLAFFQERRGIEATYIESLRRLHHKAKTVDASFDPHAEPTTTSAAWDKVRDNLEREARTQQGFVDILDNDVIKPLAALKESKDKIRKRIEDDLKGSAARYAEHAENRISKLRQAYLKKYYPQRYPDSTEISLRSQNKWLALFRGRWEDLREPEPSRPSTSKEVSDDDCREAVSHLNTLRVMRAENLGDGYDCLEEFVSTPTVENVLVKYINGMVTTCTKYGNLAMSTEREVANALTGTDISDLRAYFRRELAFSIPPSTLYRNYCSGAHSDLIFGVSLADVETNEDNVPKVMRMCMEEVEKRGLNTSGIYSVGYIHDAKVLQLRRRFESERFFSFSSTDDIHSVAALLELYLLDLPEPLFMLSLQDYRNYRQNRARYTQNGFSLLRSKIRELRPVHRASLQALLRHLLRVASHSSENAATVEALAGYLRYAVFRGNAVLQDGVHVKGLVLEDLIQNVEILFDEQPSPHSLIPSSGVAEARSTYAYDSSNSSPEFAQPAEGRAMGSSTSGLVGTETVERFLNSTPPEGVPVLSTNVSEWLARLPPHSEAPTIPQSPLESVLSNTSNFPLSSATSLQTAT